MSKRSIIEALPRFGGKFGAMLTPEAGVRLAALEHYPVWGADNGCYSRGADFSLPRYLSWLERMSSARNTCLFATAPDVVGDAKATWERSKDVLPMIRQLGYKAALVAQDGIQDMEIEWDAFDVLFIGGTTGWKLSASVWRIVREAKERGKWVHMGRVNSEARLRTALFMGCDSSDGTYLAFGPDEFLDRVEGWLDRSERVSLPEEQQSIMEAIA